jgi:hypothetical protein
MSTVLTTTTTPSPAPTMAWEPFRVLLESQRDDCLQRREIALAETTASEPDPVAMSRTATLLRTIAEIDAALDRIAGAPTACACTVKQPFRRSGWNSAPSLRAASPASSRLADAAASPRSG